MGKQFRAIDVRIRTAVVVLSLAVGGCGRPAPTSVRGQVTLAGAPLTEAVIFFVPLEAGRKKTGGAIVDGAYSVSRKNGLLPGKYRVEVADNPPLARPTGAELQPRKPRRRIPPGYSTDSRLVIEVAGNHGVEEFNFDL